MSSCLGIYDHYITIVWYYLLHKLHTEWNKCDKYCIFLCQLITWHINKIQFHCECEKHINTKIIQDINTLIII